MPSPKPGPTTAPMMTMPATPVDPTLDAVVAGPLTAYPPLDETHPLATPPEPDDVVDPVIPTALLQALAAPVPGAACTFNDHDALLSGFCMALQDRLYKHLHEQQSGALRIVDATYGTVTDRLAKLAEVNEHATYSLGEALLKLREPTVLHNPYTAVVEAVSSQGFPVTLTIAKRDAGELVQAIEGLTAWLVSAGYTTPEEVRP